MKKWFFIFILTCVTLTTAQGNCWSYRTDTFKGNNVVHFTNKCGHRIEFTYEFYDGSKWVQTGVRVLDGQTEYNNYAGSRGIRNVKSRIY